MYCDFTCWCFQTRCKYRCTPHDLVKFRRPRNRAMQCMQSRRYIHPVVPIHRPAAAHPHRLRCAVSPVPARTPRRQTSSTQLRYNHTRLAAAQERDKALSTAADATSRRSSRPQSLWCTASRMVGYLQREISCSWPSPPIGAQRRC